MKVKKSILTYVFLSLGLVVCLGGMTILGYNIFFNNEVKMANLSNMTKEDVLKWASKNKLSDYISYEYVYSSDVEEGKVVSQSLDPKEKITDKFTVSISKGSVITINESDYRTKEDFNNFIVNYPNVTVIYEDDPQSSDIGNITKYSKNSIDIKGDSITVYIAAGDSKNDDKNNEKDPKDNTEDKNSENKVLIPSNLLGTEEDKFIKTLNDLGFKNLKKDSTKYYSFTSKKDTIYSYDEGKIDTSKTIKYAISLGDYPTSFVASDYNGKKLDAAKTVVKKYNDLNAHITLKTNDVESTDSDAIGKVNNCTCAKNGYNSIITCDLYSKKAVSITVESYAGKTENEMISSLNGLGITKINKTDSRYSTYPAGVVISNDTGNKTSSDTINYTVSLGAYVANLNEYNGKTLDAAVSLANSYNSKGANVEIASPQTVIIEDNSHPNNTLYDCSNSDNNGKTLITCKLAQVITKYTIIKSSFIIQDCQTTSYDSTIAKLKGYFEGKFPNVQYNGVTSAESVGTIIAIRVNGNANYEPGLYDANTPIEVDICSEQRN